MTNGTIIWEALRKHLPKRQWVPLEKVFTIVEDNISLDAEDLAQSSARSVNPRWKTNVRNLLRVKKQAGSIRTRKNTTPGSNSP